jgi:hypothetical protein
VIIAVTDKGADRADGHHPERAAGPAERIVAPGQVLARVNDQLV